MSDLESEQNINIGPRKLFRTLSEHHWEAAAREMIRNNTTYQWAGTSIGINNSKKWLYFLLRNSPTDNKATRYHISVDNDGCKVDNYYNTMKLEKD